MRIAPAAWCGLGLWLWSLGGLAGGEPMVRVSLGSFRQPITISGERLKCQGSAPGKISRGTDQIRITPESRKRGSRPLECKAAGPITVEGRAYRGAIRISGEPSPVLINTLLVEDYLAGVINNEISSAWPVEAVKAQAILARTYTVYRMQERREREFDLETTVRDQVYQGVAAEDDAALRAVMETRGLVLTYAGQPVEALYHSSCGGRTESPEWVWGGAAKPYQNSVECGFCEDSPNYFWRYPGSGGADPAELGSKAGLSEPVMELKVLTRSPSGRAAQIRVAGSHTAKLLSGQEFREAVGRDGVRSTLFEVREDGGRWVVMGSGSGHGVGMCQWGARGMAAAGKSSEEILSHYFPGTEIRKRY